MLPLFQIISWVLQIYLLILELIIVSPDLIPYLEEIIRDLSQMFFFSFRNPYYSSCLFTSLFRRNC